MLAKAKDLSQEIIKGNKLYEKGNYKKALMHYLKAKKSAPNDFAANMNCASANFMLKKYTKSIYYLEKLKLNYQDDVKFILLLAKSHFELENYELAGEFFEKITTSGSKNPWNYNYLSQCYQKTGKFEKAFENAWSAIELSGSNNLPHQLNFGYLLYEVKLEEKYDNVLNWCKKWLEKYPDDQLVQYMGNALLGTPIKNEASLIGIRNLFDAFAPEFEKTLSDLEYKTPEEIFRILKENNIAKSKILDLGCGTGLCGKYLKNIAKLNALYGVDISKRMLNEASKKRIYSKLFCSDIVSFLRKNKNTFDLVAAADVLTYFSELDNIFIGVNKTLNPGGFFVFSITKSPNENDIYIYPSGRFAHSLKYVHSMAEKYGFSMSYFEESKLRIENNQPVKGYICLLKKNA